ncbi:MAG: hypothetical protein WAX12_07220 [Candidatus Microthrix subdominans]|jgi:hypothetical protein|uniref:hypothetical protein n=1 Tax=Candidatus Neomicrothrix sp. TaxID=2719034 RepID=UPI001B6669F6|nr:hypothetical protein [Candidatus Microthrix sp.]MBK6312568.1 hypothetical protein [Candidatus Microthrix sp.]MBK6440095.1 hypothetical protein [Candidatus Microthrix sp.]MBK6969545.1 hypothetical protein [Candidatus Microthrix sp.]MBK7164941.1 hypothetical protein [Candidatus Microthrix sp.]MBK9560428.1 hypothetical protein [Candidatus Microthrix sp.]
MATYEVHLRDGSTHEVDGVDAYQPERTMTTFFRSNNARKAIDCWSERVASFRTDELLVIRVSPECAAGADGALPDDGRHASGPSAATRRNVSLVSA